MTEWLSGATRPVHKGLYQRLTGEAIIVYSKWTGGFWCIGDTSKAVADVQVYASPYQNLPWRGVPKKE